MSFNHDLVNRSEMPIASVLVVEDDLMYVESIVKMILNRYGPQGKVSVSVAHDADVARSLLEEIDFDVLVLDHDLHPWGNGVELLDGWQRERGGGLPKTIIAHSGILANNDALMRAGATDACLKGEWPLLEGLIAQGLVEKV